MKKLVILLVGIVILATASQAYVFGVDGGTGTPYIGFQLNESQRADVGLMYFSGGGGTVTLLGRFEGQIAKKKDLSTHWAGQLIIVSAGGTTTLTLNGIAGAEYLIGKSVGIYGDVVVAGLTSAGGTTTFSLLAGSTATVYSGIRIYI